MMTGRSLTSRMNGMIRQTLGPLIGIFVAGYFGYYTVNGERGLTALTHLQGEVQEAEQVLAQLRTEREAAERRTQLLKPDNLDPDMLEERARIVLNHAHPDDLIVLLPRQDAPPAAHGSGPAKP
jgi:cell division protein FtsB